MVKCFNLFESTKSFADVSSLPIVKASKRAFPKWFVEHTFSCCFLISSLFGLHHESSTVLVSISPSLAMRTVIFQRWVQKVSNKSWALSSHEDDMACHDLWDSRPVQLETSSSWRLNLDACQNVGFLLTITVPSPFFEGSSQMVLKHCEPIFHDSNDAFIMPFTSIS